MKRYFDPFRAQADLGKIDGPISIVVESGQIVEMSQYGTWYWTDRYVSVRWADRYDMDTSFSVPSTMY
jgi:hypothetical protein